MSEHHDDCSCHTPPRRGSALEHGEAHTQDHLSWSRRDFLMRMGVAGAGVAFMMGGRPMNAFSQAPLLQALQGAGPRNRVLVLIQLAGGNDGLNTIVPVENDIYHQKRPAVRLRRNEVIDLGDDMHGMHPAMESLHPYWGSGQMGIVHTVGYANQTQSHFRGTEVWATGSDVDELRSTGWSGRYLAHTHPDYFNNPPTFPLAVRVGGATASLFQSSYGNLSMTFADSQQFNRFVEQGGFFDEDSVPNTPYGEALRKVRQVTNASYRYVESVQEAADGVDNLVEYPDSGLGRNLSVVAQMIRGRLGSSIYTVSKGGFDTHNDQGTVDGNHAGLLADLSNSVAAFLADLAEDDLDDRVMVMTFSEFGRTLSDNGSGTDHGAAAPVMLFGTGLEGGFYGTASDLTEDSLYGGDPRFTTDYRAIYQTLLEDWFGLPPEEVSELMGTSYGNLGFVSNPIRVANDTPAAVPDTFHLGATYPNPVRTTTRIPFHLDRAMAATMAVYDVQGRRVDTLLQGRVEAGKHEVRFDASDLASGTYLVRMQAGDQMQTRRLVVVH